MTHPSFLLKCFAMACLCVCLSVSQGYASLSEDYSFDDLSYVTSSSSSEDDDMEISEGSFDESTSLADLVYSEWEYLPNFNTIELTDAAMDLFLHNHPFHEPISFYLFEVSCRHNPVGVSLPTFLLNIQRERKTNELCYLEDRLDAGEALQSDIDGLNGEIAVIEVALDSIASPRL